MSFRGFLRRRQYRLTDEMVARDRLGYLPPYRRIVALGAIGLAPKHKGKDERV